MSRILFIGCVESSRLLLEELIRIKADIAGVITKERSTFNSDFYDLGLMCKKHDIPCCYVKNVNDDDSIYFIRQCNPDIGMCFGWSQLVKKEVLELFPLGMLGFHPAALPNNKGRHPLIWALVLGLDETASSFFIMTENADDGDIISQKTVRINYEDDATSLYNKIMEVAISQIDDICSLLEAGRLFDNVMTNVGGNSWRKRGAMDGRIDWRMSARAIYNMVRGLTHPYVGADFEYDGRIVKVWKASEISGEKYGNIEPGKVLAVHADGSVDIKAYDGIIRLLDHDEVKLQEGEYLL